MSVRMRSLALTSVALSTLALALPAAAAVAEPHQPERADRAAKAFDPGVAKRLVANATAVTPADGARTRPTAATARGAKKVQATGRQADAEKSGSADAASAATPGLLSASTDHGTFDYYYGEGAWDPYEFEGELNASWSPAGDRYAWTSVANGVYTNHVTNPWDGTTIDYPAHSAGHRDIVWNSLGDSFLTKNKPTDGTPSYFTQSTTRSITSGFDAGPEYGPAAIFVQGTEAYSRVALSDTTSDIVWWPYAGTEPVESPVPTRMGYDIYRPGHPAVAQAAPEALAGAWPGDPSVATNLAFLGVDPADATKGHLYVNHQESFPAKTPVPVADFAAHPECDLPAPAFSPDRRTLFFASAVGPVSAPCSTTALRSVTVGANGRFDAPDAVTDPGVTGPSGEPFRTLSVGGLFDPPVNAYRFSGQNRYEVGIETSESFYGDAAADAVVVAGGLAYADALAGGPLATSMGGPVLLTYPNSLHPGVAAEIDRVLAPGGTVYITGGAASVSTAVQTALTKPGRTVKRLAGANRYDVAVNVAKELDLLRGSGPSSAFVAGGTAFADALVAGPAATREDGPILLSNGDTLPAVTLDYLNSVDDDAAFRVYGVGGAGSRSVASRPNDVPVTGLSRYDVARAVADRFFTGEHYSALADGRNWPDAVSGGAAMASMDLPIMLTNGLNLPGQTAGRVSQSAAAIDAVFGFGGPVSIPDKALLDAADLAGTQTPIWGPDTGR